jgi:dihydroorotate dehydrogenase (NAD+) catalytic subunit
MNIDLSFNFGDMKIDPAITNGSGILSTTIEEIEYLVESGIGIPASKTTTVPLREGNKKPRLKQLENGWIQSMGLPNPGYRNIEWGKIEKLGKGVIASYTDKTEEGVEEIARGIDFFLDRYDSIREFNVACPNDGKIICQSKELLSKLIRKNRDATPPGTKLSVKIGLMYEKDLLDLIKEMEELEYKFITTTNSIPGFAIDIESRKPLIAPKYGGVSGKYLKPMSLKQVRMIYENSNLKIIGEGGIYNWRDAVEYHLAGTSVVGIGSAFLERPPKTVIDEIKHGESIYMREQGFNSLEKMIGKIEK